MIFCHPFTNCHTDEVKENICCLSGGENRNYNVSYGAIQNELGEAKGEKIKINDSLAVVKGMASQMGFASGAQQLPNNLELKFYKNTDEVCESF